MTYTDIYILKYITENESVICNFCKFGLVKSAFFAGMLRGHYSNLTYHVTSNYDITFADLQENIKNISRDFTTREAFIRILI